MPIHEYVCHACQAQFEELVRGDEAIECPVCRATKVERRFSTFATANPAKSATAGAAAVQAPGGCGTCGDPRGPGSCSL